MAACDLIPTTFLWVRVHDLVALATTTYLGAIFHISLPTSTLLPVGTAIQLQYTKEKYPTFLHPNRIGPVSPAHM